MMVAQASNDLSHDSQNPLVLGRINHVPFAIRRFDGHDLGGEIAHPFWPIDLGEAAEGFAFPKFAHRRIGVAGDEQHVSKVVTPPSLQAAQAATVTRWTFEAVLDGGYKALGITWSVVEAL